MFRAENKWMNVLSWFHSVLLCSGFYLIMAGIFSVGEKDAILLWLNSMWLFIPVVISWICIRRIRGFFGYLLAGILTTVVVVLLSGEKFLTFLFTVLIFGIRAYVRIIQGKMNDPNLPGQVKEVELWEIPTILDVPKIFHWIVFVVLYFGIIFLKQNHLLKWMFLLLFLEIFVTYVYGSLSQMKNYVVENCHIAHLPVKVMQRMQRAILGISLILLVVFVLPSVLYGEEPLTGITDLGLNLDFNLDEDVMENMPIMPDPGTAMQEMFGVEEKAPNIILEKILSILTYIIVVVGCIAGVYAVWHICQKMMNSFEKGQESDEIISLKKEGESLALRIRRTRKKAGKKSVKDKIRREYKKIILKSVKMKPAGWETPEELEEKADLKIDGEFGIYHEIYERARYSQKECDEKEIEIIKNISKKYK